ncbi:MAG: signal peptidase I [Clostridia bacterium]|nr:signal peptidase I [Clostridia bacterium]
MKENNSLMKVTKFFFDVADCLVSALIIAAIIFTFIFMKFEVLGDSMLPTLHNGDKLFVYHLLYVPQKGDIVTIDKPGVLNKNIVKRVIATHGDKVEIDFEKGKVFVNGEEDKTVTNTPTNLEASWDLSKLKNDGIPEGYVFVLGDNRNHSMDSRDSGVRLIPLNDIMGKVMCIYSPIDRLRISV